jgi:hypothetical protein
MEAVENKSKYVRRETRWHKVLRLLKKHIWVFPLLAIAGGLAIAWYMIKNIQAGSTRLPEVQYERYLTPQERARLKEEKKLELYREKMKKEKQEKFNSRYERIISGGDIIGQADFGKIISPQEPEAEKKPPNESRPAGDIYPETALEAPAEPTPKAIYEADKHPGKVKKTASSRVRKPLSHPAEEIPDSLQAEKVSADPFHTLRASTADIHQFTRAYFYGEQDVLSGSYVRLRLGEDMQVNGVHIPRNTVFRGIASISQNKIEISVEQIGLQALQGIICDQDYTPGLVLPEARNGDMEEALGRSVYQQGSGSAMDIPYEIIQDLTRNIIRNKRRKQAIIRINDGYPVFITLKNP